MKVLFLTYGPPVVASSRTRVFQYLPFLQKEGVRYKVITNSTGLSYYLVKYFRSDALVIRMTRFTAKKIQQVVDLIFSFFQIVRFIILAMFYDVLFVQKVLIPTFVLKLCSGIFKKKLVFDFEDAIMFDHRNPQKPLAGKLKRFVAAVKMADKIITDITPLVDFVKKINSSVVVIPTCLDTTEYEAEKKQLTDGKIRLVWIGSKSNLIYLNQIREVLGQIGKKYKNVFLRIICDDFLELQNIPVEKIQWSLKTQASDLINSDIGLAPLGDDNFARNKNCFKILQYAAASLPVVASSAGTNAELMSDGVTGFLVETPQQWLDRISTLIENPDLRCKMGQEAKRFVKNFDVSILGRTFVDTLLSTASGSECRNLNNTGSFISFHK